MSAPKVGDVITTAEELDALPDHAAIVYASIVWTHYPPAGWGTAAGSQWASPGFFLGDDHEPPTIVYLPGQPPRPERVVKTEALREAAATWQTGDWLQGDPLSRERTAAILGMARRATRYLRDCADRIERGES